MRILMVIDLMSLGGLETHVLTLCKGLISRGHSVFVVIGHCMGPWKIKLREVGAMIVESPEEAGSLDLIHLHVWGKAIERALAWQESLHIPMVATYHGLITNGLDQLKGKAELISISPKVHAHLGVDSTVIENGIDLEVFHFAESKLNHTVAWVGRIEGLRWLFLEALFKSCSDRGINCRIAGPFLPPEAVALLKAYRHVEWYGALFEPAHFIHDVDIVYSTSRGIREAMASGRVAVVANHMWYAGVVRPDNVEIMRRDSFMGFQDKPALPSLVGSDLETLYKYPKYMIELGRWGSQYAQNEFSADRMIVETEAVYQKARHSKVVI